MLFFGWGRRSRQWPVGDAVLVCSYTYFSIWFIFRLALKRQWVLVGDQRSQDRELTSGELAGLFPQGAPSLGLWEQYGLLIAIAAIVGVLLVSSLFSASTGGY